MNIGKYGTFKQRQIYDAARKHGYIPFEKPRKGIRAAARDLEMDHGLLGRQLEALERKAVQHDPDLHNITALGGTPEGYPIKGTSGLYKVMEDGSKVLSLEWIKTNKDLAAQMDFMKQFTEDFIGALPILDIPTRPSSKQLDTDLIPWFNIGDGHIGMMAHQWEVNHDFNLEIAERELLLAFALKIQRAPDCERCVIQDMGDMTHYENFFAKTAQSGHDLDYDMRFPMMIHVYARVMRQIVEMALGKFKYVDVIVNQGNHSRINDFWMAEFLGHVYEKTDRLKVVNNWNVFVPYRMGNTFVMSHHSDKCKPQKLRQVMSTDYAQDWGESTYRYIDIGHVHHSQVVKEYEGCSIESFNQLAPGDKHAHDHGWRSRSLLSMPIRSRTYGEVGRHILTREEVLDKLSNLPPGTTAQRRNSVYTV